MNEMIDLNSNEFDTNEVKIFNNGEAGIVNDCDFAVEAKKLDDKDNAPDWKVVITDPQGGSVNKGFWVVDGQGETLTKRIKAQGIELKSLITAVFGETKLPTFKSPAEMLNGVMQKLATANGKVKVRAIVNYGSEAYPSNYLRLNRYSPYIENMSVDLENSSLRHSKNSLLAQPEETSTEELLESTTSSTKEVDWEV